MLNYLMAYGVSAKAPRFEEIDINDKIAMEDQINGIRSDYFKLITLMDELDGKILDVKKRIKIKSKYIIEKARSEGLKPNELFSTDDEYIELEYELEALKAGKEMVASQISFAQNDLRILNSTFYSKF